MTLRDTNDFKLGNSGCASGTTFLPLYGARGDGNVYCPDNIKDFKEKVLHETQHKGVHFMMSDGVSLYFRNLKNIQGDPIFILTTSRIDIVVKIRKIYHLFLIIFH